MHLRFACVVTVPYDGEFAGCKLVGRYFHLNGLSYCFLAVAILSELIVGRYTELLASNSRSLLELLMRVDEYCGFSLLSFKL